MEVPSQRLHCDRPIEHYIQAALPSRKYPSSQAEHVDVGEQVLHFDVSHKSHVSGDPVVFK